MQSPAKRPRVVSKKLGPRQDGNIYIRCRHLGEIKVGIMPAAFKAAYSYFSRKEGVKYDWSDLDGEVVLDSRDLYFMKKPKVLSGDFQKVRILSRSQNISMVERVEFLRKADFFCPTPETWRCLTRYFLRWRSDDLASQYTNHPWLLRSEAKDSITKKEHMLGEVVLSSPKEGQITFKSEPAYTKFGTRHPFVWQVLYLPG